MSATDLLLWISGTAAEILVVVLLVWRRTYRSLPIFCGYLVFSVLDDLGTYLFFVHRHVEMPLSFFMISTGLDALFQIAVLFELTRSVLRPAANILPKWFPVLLGFLLLAVTAALWPLAGAKDVPDLSTAFRTLLHLQQSVAVLRILFFLALAAFSQLLSLDWRDRELQIATGLGLYSMVSVTVSVLHAKPVFRPQYHLLDQVAQASFLCSILYWVYCFAHKEAERREFTPQMQNLLLAMAGTARTTRVALTNKDRNPRE